MTEYTATHSYTDTQYDTLAANLATAQANAQAAAQAKDDAEDALAAYTATHTHTDVAWGLLEQDYETAQANYLTAQHNYEVAQANYEEAQANYEAAQAVLDAIERGAKDHSAFEDDTVSAEITSVYDRLVFANSSFDNCNFTRNGDDLVIEYFDDKNGSLASGTLTLDDYFTTNPDVRIDSFIDKDGNTHSLKDIPVLGVEGTSGSDTCPADSSYSNIFVVNGGNDVFNGTSGYDNDKIQLPQDNDRSDVSYYRTANEDLVIKYNGGTISVPNYDDMESSFGQVKLIVDGGVEFDIATDLERKGIYIEGTTGNNAFDSTKQLKEIFVAEGGNDTFECAYNDGGGYVPNTNIEGDKIKLLGTRADVFYTKNGDDLIINYNGGTVTMSNYDRNEDAAAIKLITTDAEFYIASDLAAKGLYTIVNGTPDDDNFTPTANKEIFVVAGGNDVFYAYGDNNDGDILQVSGNRSYVTYSADLNSSDLIINYGTDGDSVKFLNYFTGNTHFYPETLKTEDDKFSIGSDLGTQGLHINGTSGSDTFSSNLTGKEIFVANGGHDTYTGNAADSYVQDDAFLLSGDIGDVSYIQDNKDLIINYGAGSDSITLTNYFDSGYYYPETLIAEDSATTIADDWAAKGYYVDGSGNLCKTVTGTPGTDTFTPTDMQETFIVAGGNDVFYGNIYNNDGDILQVSGNSSYVTYSRDLNSSDLIINYGTNGDSVKLVGYDGVSSNYYPDTIKTTGDSAEFNIATDKAAKGIHVNGTPGDDSFSTTNVKEIFVANGGNDTLSGSSDTSYTAGDAIKLSGNRINVNYTKDSSDHLVIHYGTGSDTFTCSDFLGNSVNYYPDTIITDDESAGFDILADINSKGVVQEGETGDDNFYLTRCKDVIVAKGGHDTCDSNNGSGITSGDTIQLLGNKTNVSCAMSGDDIIITYDGGQITMSSYSSYETEYNALILKTSGDSETFTLGSIVNSGGISASNNFMGLLLQDTSAWQSAGADSAMSDVALNNPEDVNLMQIYTNNA